MQLDAEGFPTAAGDPTPERWTPQRLAELRGFVGPEWHEAFDVLVGYGSAREQDEALAQLDGLERSARARQGQPRPTAADDAGPLFSRTVAASVRAHDEALAKVHRIGYRCGEKLDRHEVNATQVGAKRRALVERYAAVVWGVGRRPAEVVGSAFDLGLSQGYGAGAVRRG